MPSLNCNEHGGKPEGTQVMDLGTMILLLLLAGALIGGVKAYRLRDEWASFQQWQAAGMPMAGEVALQDSPTTAGVHFDTATIPGAGRALANPPSDFESTLTAVRAKDLGSFAIPLGWEQGGIVTAKLVGDVNHVLITGQSDSGKDNATMGIFYALAMQNDPQRVQFAIIDGKGLDWAAWNNKAHTWRLALSPEDIAPAMLALTNERKRRLGILQTAGVTKWDTYQGGDLPLLVVYISELLLCQNATSGPKLTAWLNSELTAARAFGIRYIIATQTASNFDTQWRSQISLFLAGFQPTPTQDMPNVGISTKELETIGAVPPSQLPAPPIGAGVFTAVQGRHVATVRATFLDDNQRAKLLAIMPTKRLHLAPAAVIAPAMDSNDSDGILLELLKSGQPLPLEALHSGATGQIPPLHPLQTATSLHNGSDNSPSSATATALHVALDKVPVNEQQRILAAAAHSRSRRDLCKRLYETTGGQKYNWIAAVCDAHGLLQTNGATS